MLANDTWQKEEILAAKLENFLTTVLIFSSSCACLSLVVVVHRFFLDFSFKKKEIVQERFYNEFEYYSQKVFLSCRCSFALSMLF